MTISYVVHYEMMHGNVDVIREILTRIDVEVDAWIEINRELRKLHGERYKIISYLREVVQGLEEYFA